MSKVVRFRTLPCSDNKGLIYGSVPDQMLINRGLLHDLQDFLFKSAAKATPS